MTRAFAAARVLGADCAAEVGTALQRQSEDARSARERYAQRSDALHGAVDESASACATALQGQQLAVDWLEQAPPPDVDRAEGAARPQVLSLVFDRGCAEACEVLVAALTCDPNVLTFGRPTRGSAELFGTGMGEVPALRGGGLLPHRGPEAGSRGGLQPLRNQAALRSRRRRRSARRCAGADRAAAHVEEVAQAFTGSAGSRRRCCCRRGR